MKSLRWFVSSSSWDASVCVLFLCRIRLNLVEMEKVEIKANVFQFSKCPINAIFCWRKSGVSLQEGSRLFLTSSCFQPSSSWCHCQYPAKCRRQCQAGVINLSIYHKLIHNFYIVKLRQGSGKEGQGMALKAEGLKA